MVRRAQQEISIKGKVRASKKPRKPPWTQEEDEKLIAAIRKHGAGNWSMINAVVPDRERNECYKRFFQLNPDGQADMYRMLLATRAKMFPCTSYGSMENKRFVNGAPTQLNAADFKLQIPTDENRIGDPRVDKHLKWARPWRSINPPLQNHSGNAQPSESSKSFRKNAAAAESAKSSSSVTEEHHRSTMEALPPKVAARSPNRKKQHVSEKNASIVAGRNRRTVVAGAAKRRSPGALVYTQPAASCDSRSSVNSPTGCRLKRQKTVDSRIMGEARGESLAVEEEMERKLFEDETSWVEPEALPEKAAPHQAEAIEVEEVPETMTSCQSLAQEAETVSETAASQRSEACQAKEGNDDVPCSDDDVSMASNEGNDDVPCSDDDLSMASTLSLSSEPSSAESAPGSPDDTGSYDDNCSRRSALSIKSDLEITPTTEVPSSSDRLLSVSPSPQRA